MHRKVVGYLFSLLACASATAGTITVTNVNGQFTEIAIDNAGNPLVGTYVGIGTLSDPNTTFATLSAAEVEGMFTPFASGITEINQRGNPFIDPAMLFAISGAADFTTSTFRGSPMHLILGNAETLSGSTAYGIMRIGTFPTSEPSSPDPIIMQGSAAEVLWGNYCETATNGTGVLATTRPAFTVGHFESPCSIPEPNTTVLFGVALAGLLLQRRL